MPDHTTPDIDSDAVIVLTPKARAAIEQKGQLILKLDLLKVVLPELVSLTEYTPDIDADTRAWLATTSWDIVEAVVAEGQRRGAL
jgi:hypothetical protein